MDDTVGPHLSLLREGHGLPLACRLVDPVLVTLERAIFLQLEAHNRRNNTGDQKKPRQAWGSECDRGCGWGTVFDRQYLNAQALLETDKEKERERDRGTEGVHPADAG